MSPRRASSTPRSNVICREKLLQPLVVPVDWYQAIIHDSIETVVQVEELPEIAKVGAAIDIAASELELDISDRPGLQQNAGAVQDAQLQPFYIELQEIDMRNAQVGIDGVQPTESHALLHMHSHSQVRQVSREYGTERRAGRVRVQG
jgi:hypothetical protein